MLSLTELFRIGAGPSSSHTMGPQIAARQFLNHIDRAAFYRVTLYGSLAATGQGHMTDRVLSEAFEGRHWELIWTPDVFIDYHPNGLLFEAFESEATSMHDCEPIQAWEVFSVGGGALREAGSEAPQGIYTLQTMKDILDWCVEHNQPIWAYVEQCEGEQIWLYLSRCWTQMQESIHEGLRAEGVLPGGLGLRRKAKDYFQKVAKWPEPRQHTGVLSSYALAMMEQNASAGAVVTAPTCGACGVVPAILRYGQEVLDASDEAVLQALATAGLIGNLVKHNASISGAEVGCQGEVGTACAMAAAGLAQMMGATPAQVEYAAEMGMEHHLGLTCDPVLGLVQIPCIERNAFAAHRAWACAEYALLGDGHHEVSFDTVVETMYQTGKDLDGAYRETGVGGLALEYLKAQHPM